MPLLIQPTTTVRHFTTQTTQGEVTVNINLTLTLAIDQTGNLVVKGESVAAPVNIPDYVMQIPECDDETLNLFEFGKDVE